MLFAAAPMPVSPHERRRELTHDGGRGGRFADVSVQDPQPDYAPNEVRHRLRRLQPRRHTAGEAPW